MKMQSIHFTAFAVAAMLACVGCSEFFDRDNFSPESDKIAVSAYASIAETRVDVGEFDGEHYPLTWSAEDALAITTSESGQESDTASKFTITDGIGAKEATFEGEVSKTEQTYYAVYPYMAFRKAAGDTFTLSLPAKQISGPNSLIDSSAVILLSNGAKITDSKLNFNFNHISAYAKLALKGLEAGQLKSVTFSTDDACIAGTFTCSPDGSIEGGGCGGNQ